jgi:hypothetical protein
MTDPNPIKADQVRHNDMNANLGPDEAVAVDDSGNIIARSTREDIEKTYPGYSVFGAKDFKGKGDLMPKPIDTPVFNAPPPGVPTTPSGLPITDALADDPTPAAGTRTHPLDDGTPYEGPPAVDGQELGLKARAAAMQGGQPIKDALEASHQKTVEAEQAGDHVKQDDAGAAQAKVLDQGKKAAAKKYPLDHDSDGRKGGNIVSRQRKAKNA